MAAGAVPAQSPVLALGFEEQLTWRWRLVEQVTIEPGGYCLFAPALVLSSGNRKVLAWAVNLIIEIPV